ncbi:MAG: hypothetical protein CVU06_08505 [Bacteroidetes bacterium HGW-Bacteroidetes-22]|nr:MAG: hypothetical protein CVU06_08505 [Bacteroidetes bacterium HGW-Bacteroidetes-22]
MVSETCQTFSPASKSTAVKANAIWVAHLLTHRKEVILHVTICFIHNKFSQYRYLTGIRVRKETSLFYINIV